MFLAVVRMPERPDALERAAAASGQVLADVRRRLAGVLPRVLLVTTHAAAIARCQEELAGVGFVTVAFDPLRAPTDADRLVARSLELAPDELVIVTGVGVETLHMVPLESVRLMQRGARDGGTQVAVTKERKFSLGRALLTSGLSPTTSVEKRTTTMNEPPGDFVLLQRDDGGPEVVIYERRISYRFLGASLSPLSRTNLEQTVALLRGAIPGAPLDDRVGKPGFVSGMPTCGRDPLDVALQLTWLAHRATAP